MREAPSTPLLLTKITVPPQRRHVMPRERLLQRMPRDGPARLIVLSAPAGAGKTTFLAHWCQTLLADGSAAVAWYSLDAGDNDPARFAAYLLGAFRAATATTDFQPAAALLETIPGQGLEPVLAALLNAITLDSRTFVLVLDDYHTITAPEVHLALTFLLDHAPAQLSVVIGSRATPPLHLARLRVREQLIELHMADLRFSTEEVRDFFDHSLDFPLSAETAQLIEDSSEGWAAGLQLIALSLTGHGPAVGEATLRETLARLALSRHLIFDYLADEVFEQQAPETRQFLLATSALGRLSGELCDAVIDGHSSRAMLEQLEQSNLFVVPLDADRVWYRYHHLFGDFLEERREREQPEQTAEIHRRASAWYRAAGMITPAIEHALAGADYTVAGELIDAVATMMNARGETATLRGWLERLPRAVVEQRPDLSLWWAWSMIFEGKLAESVAFLDRAEHAWSAEHNPAKLGGVWHARAHLARIRGDAAATLRYAQQALADLPEDAATLRAGSILALGAGYLLAGDLRLAEQTLHHAQILCRTSNFLGLVTTSVCLGDLAVLRGQYDSGVACYQEAQDLADGRQIMGQLEARIKLAEVWRERNDLEAARAALQQALAVAESTGYAPHLPYGYIILGRVLQARGDVSEAGRLFEHGIEVAEQAGSAFYRREAEAYLTRLRLVQGDITAVAAWYARSEAMRDSLRSDTSTTETLTDARILIAREHADRALALLQRLRIVADSHGQAMLLVEIELLRALALERLQRRQEALHALECALRRAAPANVVRLFLDEGSACAELLGNGQAIGGWGLVESEQGVPVRAYARALLTAPAGDAHAAAQQSENQRRTPTGEIISAREIDVLRLMARGASNQEIADTLIVSLGTVKSHLTHIMGKLQARNRTEAVARARELGYLSA